MVQGSTGTGYGGFIYLYHPKEWQQAYYKATKPKRQAYGKKYYELNKEKLLKKSKEDIERVRKLKIVRFSFFNPL
jgi:hypothetical protein